MLLLWWYTIIEKVKIILFSILSIISLFYIKETVDNKNKQNHEKKLIEAFFSKDGIARTINNEDKYIGILEIPKIKLKRGFYSINDKRNNIEENITIIKEEKNLIVLAAHSGNSEIAYFNNIHYLDKDDLINIYYNNKKIVYKVISKYLDDKDNKVKIKPNNIKRLILITCNNFDNNNYLIIEAYKL